MFTPKTVPLLALSLTSALLLTSCSSGGFGDLKETVVGELETIVENENNPNENSLPVVEVDNVVNANMEIVDNESNRKVAALTLEEVLTDIASFKVDEESELSSAFQVMSIPTVIVMKNGSVTGKSVGLRPRKSIEAML